MRQRPWFIIALAVFHIAAPIGNLFLNAFWANIYPQRYLELYLQPHNLVSNLPGVLLPIAAGLCILICRKWSFMVYFPLMSLLCLIDFNSYQERMLEMNMRTLFSILSLNVVTMFCVMHPRIRRIYLEPQLRWWETKPRYVCDLPVQLESSLGTVQGLAKNFSETGLLLDLPKSIPNQEFVKLVIGAGDEKIVVDGQVVRHHPAHLNEFGVRFTHSKQSKKRAKQLAAELRSKGLSFQEAKPSFIDSLTQ